MVIVRREYTPVKRRTNLLRHGTGDAHIQCGNAAASSAAASRAADFRWRDREGGTSALILQVPSYGASHH